MSIIRSYLYVVLILANVMVNAQDTAMLRKFDPGNLNPIVQVFGTARYNFQDSQYGFHFGRAHLGFEYSFNEKWSSKIVIDRGKPTTLGDLIVVDSLGNQLDADLTYSEGAYYSMFLKFASLRWNVNNKLSIEAGAVLQNHYITQERFWGFRYISQTFQDLYWHIPSTDLGFIAYYKLNRGISFDIALTNGEGPRIKQDELGNIKVAGGVNISPVDFLQTRMYYHFREAPQAAGKVHEQMFSFFAGIKPFSGFRIGGEFNYMLDLEGISGLESYGYSIYSAYTVYTRTEIFVRFDRLICSRPDGFVSTVLQNGNAILGGVSYSPAGGVNLSLNYHGWLFDNKETEDQHEIALSMEYKF